MRTVSFQLTMPNVGSWNGKWSGAANKYYIIKSLTDKQTAKLLPDGKLSDSWHYSWSDGWGANVTAEIIDAKEARKRRKVSSGFCGYGWMVDNILWFGTPYGKKEELV